MILYEYGSKKYFNNDLLTYLKKKENDKFRQILDEYQMKDPTSKVCCVRDTSQATLLHYASDYGNEGIVKDLINLGSEVEAQDNLGRTPLMLAVIKNREEVVEILLKASANIHLLDSQNQSALHMIFDIKTTSQRIINAFIEHVTLDRMMEGTASKDFAKKLHATGFTLNQAVLTKSVQLMKLLLDQGYHSVNEKESKEGKTALHTALDESNVDMVRVLLEYDADVDVLDNSKSTPLWYINSCDNGNYGTYLEILATLLTRAVLLTASNGGGSMQIRNILTYEREAAVKLVLQHIDNLYVADERGNTVVHYMARNRDASVIELLRSRKYNVNARNKTGDTPLHWAATERSPHAVEFLLENRADVHARGSHDPLTCLYRSLSAYSSEAIKCIQLLLDHGSNVDDGGQKFIIISQLHDHTPTRLSHEVEEAKRTLTLVEPILAHLAVDRARGIKISEETLFSIERQPSWVDYFGMCIRQVEQMKLTKFYGSMTMFQFLTEKQNKITAYVRNEQLISELGKMIEGFETNSPYPDLLRSCIARAKKLAELREKAIASICWLINPNNNQFYIVAESIIEYLTITDMKNLNSVVQSYLQVA